jgi:signal transduction histidine kinase
MRDISDRKRTEREARCAQDQLERLNRTLEARVREEVAQREAAQARAAQAERMQALGQLAGGIAHDFNNLLTAALGNLDRLVDRLNDQTLRDMAEQSLSAIERAEVLTRKLLAFGRKQPLQIETLDLRAVLREEADLIKRTLSRGTEFELRLLEDLWPVRADRDQLELAVLNLVANARDAMPESSGRLTITAANVVLPEGATADGLTGEFVALSVSDTGAGIPAAIRERIFEPFFTTKVSGKGTGLGLAMVYGFTKQLGGTTTVRSEEGQGTTVRLYLPRDRRDTDR